MKRLISLFLLTLCVAAFADNFTKGHLQRLESLKSPNQKDFEHEFPGCPENSICTKELGKKWLNWHTHTDELKGVSSELLYAKLSKAISNLGIPLIYLIPSKEFEASKAQVTMWKTRCRNHNSAQGPLYFKGVSFEKKIQQTENKQFIEVIVRHPDHGQSFFIPFDQSPLMVKQGKLIVTQDVEDLYFNLAISSKGELSLYKPSANELQKATLEIERIECPKKTDLHISEAYPNIICKKIWNFDTSSTVEIQSTWACP